MPEIKETPSKLSRVKDVACTAQSIATVIAIMCAGIWALFTFVLEEQEKDIKQSLKFLDSVGASTTDWVMCYPYGAYNDSTISLLESFDAALGITTEVRVANLTSDNPFTLPRLDTNDFPQ